MTSCFLDVNMWADSFKWQSELEVTRLDLVEKRRWYMVEKRWSDGGGGMFI